MTMSWKQHNDLYICVLLKLKYYEYSNNKYIKWIQYTKFHHHFSYSRTIYDQLKLVLCHMSINCGDMFTLFWRNITIFWYHTFWRWSRERDRGEKKARWGSVFYDELWILKNEFEILRMLLDSLWIGKPLGTRAMFSVSLNLARSIWWLFQNLIFTHFLRQYFIFDIYGRCIGFKRVVCWTI